MPDLKIDGLVQDAELLAEAREAAFALVDRDDRMTEVGHVSTREHFARTAPRSLGFARVG